MCDRWRVGGWVDWLACNAGRQADGALVGELSLLFAQLQTGVLDTQNNPNPGIIPAS